MITINLKNIPFSYSKAEKAFTISEKDVQFGTEYNVISPKTGDAKVFKFTHSTGCEFEPDTQWIYKNDEHNILLKVCNDAKMAKEAADAYLKAKLGKNEKYIRGN